MSAKWLIKWTVADAWCTRKFWNKWFYWFLFSNYIVSEFDNKHGNYSLFLNSQLSVCGPSCSILWVFVFGGGSAGAGGPMVVQVSLTTVTRIRFRLGAIIWLKLPLSHVRRVLFSLTLPSIAGFLRVFRFPPVVTLNSWMVASTGPLGRIAQVADRVIQFK